MRILLITDGAVPTSSGAHRAPDLVLGLAKRGHQITVICAQPPENKSIISLSNVEFVYASRFRKWSLTGRAKQFISLRNTFLKIVRNKKFDVIRSLALLSSYIVVTNKKKFDIPVVVSLTDFAEDFLSYLNLPIHRIVKKMEQEIMQKSDVVIVDTSLMRKIWGEYGLTQERGVVVPHGIDEEKFSPENSSQRVRNLYKLGKEKVIFFHGDISPIDGINEVFVDVIELVVKKLSSVKVMVVGEGTKSYQKYLLKMIEGRNLLKNFIFTGRVPYDDVPEYINCADVCLVTPNDSIRTSSCNMPFKILEYIGMGKPIVSSPVDGLREMFSEVIFFAKGKSPETISEAILEVLSNRLLQDEIIRKTKVAREKLLYKNIILEEEKVMQALAERKTEDFRIFDMYLDKKK